MGNFGPHVNQQQLNGMFRCNKTGWIMRSHFMAVIFLALVPGRTSGYYGPLGPHPVQNELRCGAPGIAQPECVQLKDCVYNQDRCIFNTKGSINNI